MPGLSVGNYLLNLNAKTLNKAGHLSVNEHAAPFTAKSDNEKAAQVFQQMYPQ